MSEKAGQISEREAYEGSLLKTIIDSVPDAMIVIDAKGDILAFSCSAEALFGYAAQDVVGCNVSKLMPDRDRAHHDSYITNYVATGEKQIIGKGRVVEARLSDGRVIPVHLTIAETHINGRRIFAGYIRDVTREQAADHQLTRLQAELTSFSRLSAVGTMASAMAHELNQPLTAVANYLEAARDLLKTPDAETIAMVEEALDAAARQSIRAGQIVRRLRDYVSRGEFEKRAIKINQVIGEAIAVSKIGVQGQLPRIVFQPEENIPLVLVDRLQIRQVVLNLIRNAIDALADVDNPLIHVSARCTEPSVVVVEVRDNGGGLDLEDGRSPFEPFQSSKSDGMGLGLSICQTIIDAHDGEIWTETEPDSGAIFKFSLTTAD